jgi:sirohydrochlorin ferrochelatase
VAHGSRFPAANAAAGEIAAMVRAETPYEIVEVAFREMHPPAVQTAIDRCVALGAERILLIPYFLFVGSHVRDDLPVEMTRAQERYPQVEFALGNHLGVHRKLAEIVIERISEGLLTRGWQ